MSIKATVEVHGGARVGGGHLRGPLAAHVPALGSDRPTPVGTDTRGGTTPPAHPFRGSEELVERSRVGGEQPADHLIGVEHVGAGQDGEDQSGW